METKIQSLFEVDEFIKDITPDIIINNDKVVRTDKNWTIETIYSQLEQGNIDLNPSYQRRKAWDDERKISLIESIILRYPIPELVLAEHPKYRNTYIVVDGKQRLLTIAGFINPEKYNYWDVPKLRWDKEILDKQGKESLKKILNDKDYKNIEKEIELKRIFMNADMRCAIITHTPSEEVIYDIFYRLNAGAEPLTFQELRQALYRGGFSDYLMEITLQKQLIHEVMGLEEPDNRLVDIEMLLRLFAVKFRGSDYKGDLKKFLDDTMEFLNKNWIEYERDVKLYYEELNHAIKKLARVFGSDRQVAKLPPHYSQFNKALCEVELYYFAQLPASLINEATLDKFRNEFLKIYQSKASDSVRLATNSTTSFKHRFEVFQNLVNTSFGTEFTFSSYARN